MIVDKLDYILDNWCIKIVEDNLQNFKNDVFLVTTDFNGNNEIVIGDLLMKKLFIARIVEVGYIRQ